MILQAPAKRLQHGSTTYRNIVGRNMLRAFGHRVATCCDMLGVVGSNLTIFKLFWGLLLRDHLASSCSCSVPKKDVIILLPYLGLHSNHITKRLKSCVNRFYSFVNVKVIFQNTRRIKSFFPYKDRLHRSQLSKVIYKASCWDCNDFYIGKTKQRLHDRKTEHFKALVKNDHSSAIADHVKKYRSL